MSISDLRKRILGGSGGGHPPVASPQREHPGGMVASGGPGSLQGRLSDKLPDPRISRPMLPDVAGRTGTTGHSIGQHGHDLGPGVGRRVDDLLDPGRPHRPRPQPEDRFQDRARAGHLGHLSKGETAQRIHLDEQYRLHQQGDVARRMGFHKHLPDASLISGGSVMVDRHRHPGLHYGPAQVHVGYHGHISPRYTDQCFRHHYHGPGYFPSTVWYPHWHPWVAWSWHYRCPLTWDPRPLWCRPIVYASCVDWVPYAVPTWEPLPSVSCGTWIEVERPPLVDRSDLQLLAVRFVDAGHPEEQLGPRYRVWFRNNGQTAIVTPLDVTLLASNDGRLVSGLPQAGVRVTSVEAGDTQAVDIRLPLEVGTMGRDGQGQTTPFQTLHVLVDANRVIDDPNRANNGSAIPRDQILPVDPATFESQPDRQAAGGEVILAGEGYGPGPGKVMLVVAGQELDAEILGWYDLGVRVRLPVLGMNAPLAAELIVIRGDGAAANPIRITIDPQQATGPELLPPPPQ